LADYEKDEVRKIAKENNLIVADKPGSQDICFIPNKKHREFLAASGLNEQPGEVVHIDGRVLGKHQGVASYTVGQRSGLGIAHTEPLYIIEIDCKNNNIIVGSKKDLDRRTLFVSGLNLLVDHVPKNLLAKIRYAHKPAACSISDENNTLFKVTFQEAQSAITSGQSIVFYSDDIVVGGGIIEKIA